MPESVRAETGEHDRTRYEPTCQGDDSAEGVASGGGGFDWPREADGG
jgi:hypothetical protein